MTSGAIGQSLPALQITQGNALPVKQDSPEIQEPVADTTQLSGSTKPEETNKTKKFLGWLKEKMEDNKELTTGQKITRVVARTAIGAGVGAALIASGAAPAVCATVGAVTGAVALGLAGTFFGFLGGMIAEKGGHRDAMTKWTARGAIGGGLIGAGIGGVEGWAQAHLLVALAGAAGGGPIGGAIVGAAFSGISALISVAASHKKPAAAQNGPAPQQQPPAQPALPSPPQDATPPQS